MKNVVSCPNCGIENPFYKYTCSNCKAYLRDRVFNLDLWQIIGLLIESPVRAFNRIIQSEHKNFIILIGALFSVKVFIDARYLSILFSGENTLRVNLIPALLISLGTAFLVIWIFTFIFFFISKLAGLKTRLRDNNAVLTYTLLPYPVALLILFPIELIVFGQFLFSNNPSPFIIKPAVAYTLLAFEALLTLWAIILSVTGVYSISRNFIYAVISGLIFNFYIFGYMILLSFLLFA